jgi:hypothetical protein
MSLILNDPLRTLVRCSECKNHMSIELLPMGLGGAPRQLYQTISGWIPACRCGATTDAKYAACFTVDHERLPAFQLQPAQIGEAVTGEEINDVLVKQVATLEHENRTLRALLADLTMKHKR